MPRYRRVRRLTGILVVGLASAVSGVAGEPPKPLRASGETFTVTDDERQKIEAAIPAKPVVAPAKPRRLLIFDLNVGYGGHRSIAHANLAFTLMGKKTGAFETVVSHEPAVFAPASLRQFDAVFLNNTVGNPFDDSQLRRSLLEFVTGGGGLMGVHGTTVAFTRWPGAHEDWPEFGFLLGARGAAHRAQDERVVVRLDDPEHPLVAPFGRRGFERRDEFFRVGAPYSRDRLRVLLSIDTEKTDLGSGPPERADHDYALAWVRHYGRGRVFYSTIAHHPSAFWDPTLLRFYLSAAQFVLGDLAAPTTPSAKLTPAMRAQEKLGWRLGIEAYTFHKFTFFEAIDKTAQLGLPYIGGLSFQKVSHEIPKNFDPQLSDDELRAIRLKLDAAGLRLLTYFIHDLPKDEAACRRIFEFGRKMGIETFLSEPKLEALDTIERLCDEYGINVGLHNHDEKASPHYWHPEKIAKLCQGRSRRLGAGGDVGYWLRSGIDPVEGVRTLKDRLITVQMHDLHARGPEGHDVPWGTGVGQAARLFEVMHAEGARPTMIGLEYSYHGFESMPEIARSIEFFHQTAVRLARGTP